VRNFHVLRSVYDFIRLGRPLFLLGGVLFYWLGVAMALVAGASLDIRVLLLGQVVVTASQIMTHYSNDYFDLEADKANQTPTQWSGGSRVLAEDRLPPQIALATAVVMGLVALAVSLWLALVVQTGPLTLPLLLLSIALAWLYSSPPLYLQSTGYGELAAAILLAVLTPLLGFYLQSGRRPLEMDALLPILALLPLFYFQFNMLLIVNYPDEEADAAVGKRTLLVRWGGARVARLYLMVLLAAYVTLPFLVLLDLPAEVALAVFLVSPLGLWLAWRMLRGAWANPEEWNSLEFWTIGLLMVSATAEFLAFLWLLLG
jgi:1,4-dihydroxy-2-naphthoate octaprenyltransferase